MPASRLAAVIHAFVCVIALGCVYATWAYLGKPQVLDEITSSSHKLQCVSYSPFDKDQTPLVKGFQIRDARIDADLALLAKYFSCIRTYSTTGLENLPAFARKHGLKLMLGAWVSPDEKATQLEIDQMVAAANNNPDVITAVIVGNEALLRKDISGTRLAELIHSVKQRVRQPVTYADVWEFWLQHPQVAPAVDFITIHLLPYWENDPTGIDRALAHVAEVREEFGKKFPDKDILIGETGWPSEGRQRETAIPSRVNQAKFVRGFVQMAEQNNWQYNLIEAFDQPWKRVNEGAVGGYWGLFDADRLDKHILAGEISNLPHWKSWALLSLGIVVVVLLASGLPHSVRDAFAVPIVTAISAVCISLWWLQAVNDNRDYWEWSWSCAITLLNAAMLLRFTCLRYANEQHVGWRCSVAHLLERRAASLVLLCAFVAAVMMLQLVFDARYREFAWYALLPMTLALLLAPVRNVSQTETSLLCAVIVLGIPLQLWQETLLNAQAVAWAIVSASFSSSLWLSIRASRSMAINNANTAGVTV